MSEPLIPGRDLPSLESLGAEAAQLLQQLDLLSQNGRTGGDFDPPPETAASNASRHDWPPQKKTLEEEDEGRFGCSWPELDDKLRFHPNWEVRRDTLYYVRDNACKKDTRVMTTLKYMARRDGNVNVKLLAAEVLVHVSVQTLPEQIWMLGHENWFERKNAINALEFAAEPEDDAVMTALSMSMSDASANVRSAAVQSLMNLARKRKNTEHQFPPFVLQQLLERLSDQDSRVRAAAAAGIVEVALPGDRDLVQDLAQKMQSRVTDIRRGASEGTHFTSFLLVQKYKY
jgi:HEAT repeat protein